MDGHLDSDDIRPRSQPDGGNPPENDSWFQSEGCNYISDMHLFTIITYIAYYYSDYNAIRINIFNYQILRKASSWFIFLPAFHIRPIPASLIVIVQNSN